MRPCSLGAATFPLTLLLLDAGGCSFFGTCIDRPDADPWCIASVEESTNSFASIKLPGPLLRALTTLLYNNPKLGFPLAIMQAWNLAAVR